MYIVITSQIIALGVTVKKLPPTALEGRKYVTVQNVGSVTVYVGTSAITADTSGTGGFQLLPKAVWSEPYSDNAFVYGLIASGSSQVYIEEGK